MTTPANSTSIQGSGDTTSSVSLRINCDPDDRGRVLEHLRRACGAIEADLGYEGQLSPDVVNTHASVREAVNATLAVEGFDFQPTH